jgi:hypothetical protein
MEDDNDLLGTISPRRRGCPPKVAPQPHKIESAPVIRRSSEPSQETLLRRGVAGLGLEDVGGVQALRRPVTIKTLATIFDHDVQTITTRLIDCPFTEKSGRKLYEFKEACSYIIKPKMTITQFVKTLNVVDLPPQVNKAFWDGQRSRVKYMIEAQEAWQTDDVLDVFGKTFMTIKDWTTTLVEMLRERAHMTDEQTEIVEQACDDLRSQLRAKLLDEPKKHRTTSLFDKPLFGVTGGKVEDDEDEE